MSDLISRQAAIEAICKACSIEGDYHECDGYPETSTCCEGKVALKALPSAQPERKKGKWIHEIVNSYTEKTYCSECGKSALFVYVSDDYYGVHTHGEIRKTDFCPHCGADMREERRE